MNPYLLNTLEIGPVVVRRLLDQVPGNRLDEALVKGRFTAREVIAHLADWEPIMRGRILTTATSPGATIEVFDEGEMAIRNKYASTDPWEQCDLFQRERHATAAFVRSLEPDDWQQITHHPERGPLSAEDLTNLLLGHDLYHIDQLSAYLPDKQQ
jgi:hypothetical protein